MMRCVWMILFLMCHLPAFAQTITVHDDTGQTLQLNAPVQRIVSLSPHITELLFDAGANHQIVGTVDYSDYPEAAKSITRVGGFAQFDFEAVAASKPELVIAWHTGNPVQQLEGIKRLGIPIFYSEPSTLDDIATTLRTFGVLLGRKSYAERRAQLFELALKSLRKRYQQLKPVSVFYQVWDSPLMTVNDTHMISDVIRLCGGVNVFADLPVISPRVDMEAVILKQPDVIVAGVNAQRDHWLPQWQQWKGIPAVANQHVYALDPDLITRQTPRVLRGAHQLCNFLQRAR